MKIKTNFINPPIPVRAFDWCAVDDDTYDGTGCPIGFGPTAETAIEDLMDQINNNGKGDHDGKTGFRR